MGPPGMVPPPSMGPPGAYGAPPPPSSFFNMNPGPMNPMGLGPPGGPMPLNALIGDYRPDVKRQRR